MCIFWCLRWRSLQVVINQACRAELTAQLRLSGRCAVPAALHQWGDDGIGLWGLWGCVTGCRESRHSQII